MNKFLLTAILGAASVSGMHAELEGDGYYRIQNWKTDRYAYVTDNKGSVDTGATKVDARAIQLWKGFERASHDPATVIYIKHFSGTEYDFQAQGMDLYDLFGTRLRIISAGDGLYYAYATKDGFSTYLADGEAADMEKGVMINTNKGDYRKWEIHPISADGDQYFGVYADLKAGDKYYTTMYASFPMKAQKSGLKAYTVTQVGYGMAVYEEVSGVIPGGTPVIWESTNSQAGSNRVVIGGEGQSAGTNQLGGVYFCNSENGHVNRTAYNGDTMRILGKLSDGSIGFVKAYIDYLPANKAYLKVPAGTPDELRLVTKAEYDAYVSSMPTSITVTPATSAMHVGESLKLSVNFLPEGSRAIGVNWTSSNPAVATVSADGTVKAVGNGNATITATTTEGNVLSAGCNVTVTTLPTSLTVSPVESAMHVGDNLELTFSFAPEGCETYPVTWTSSNPAVATVSAEGVVSAVADGNATITATTSGGAVTLSAGCNVTVTTLPSSVKISPADIALNKGEMITLTATVEPANAEKLPLVWWSDDENVATVSTDGTVTATGNGVTSINVIVEGLTVSDKATVTVTTLAEGLTLDPTNYKAEPGAEFTIVATVLPEDASDKSVVWASDNEAVATVDGTGLVKVLAEGEATITCTTADGSDIKATCHVTAVSGIDEILAGGKEVDIYTTTGIVVKRKAGRSDIESLPAGIYVIGGHKIVKK